MHDAQEHSNLATFFFVTFQVVASYVLLNLFVAIILDQMSDQMDAVKEQATQLKQFSAVWKEVKLASVGGDVMSLAVNSSDMLKVTAGAVADGSELGLPAGDDAGTVASPGGRPRRASMFDRISGRSTDEDKKAKFAVKEKNVHFIPAFYLKKLVRKMPKPLGLAEIIDEEEDLAVEPGNGKAAAAAAAQRRRKALGGLLDRVKPSTEKDFVVLRFIRECDIPVVDGMWVRYKDVMHALFFRAAREQKEEEEEGGGDAGGEDVQWFHLKQFQRVEDLEHDGKLYMSDMNADPNDSRGMDKDDVENKDDVIGRKTQLSRQPSNKFTADEWFGAVVMQAWFRGSRGRMRAKRKKEQMEKKRDKRRERAERGEWLGGGADDGGFPSRAGGFASLVQQPKAKKDKKKKKERSADHIQRGHAGHKYERERAHPKLATLGRRRRVRPVLRRGGCGGLPPTTPLQPASAAAAHSSSSEPTKYGWQQSLLLVARFARAPRFCPLLPQKSSSAFFFERAHEIRMAAAPSSCCSLRSRPSILPASAAEEQPQQQPLLHPARFARAPSSPRSGPFLPQQRLLLPSRFARAWARAHMSHTGALN
jgi:hypothetical protein